MATKDTKLQIVIDAENRTRGAFNELEGTLGKVQKSYDGLQKGMVTAGAAGAAVFTAASAASISAVRSFETFNQEIERAGAFVNASAEEMKGFREAAIAAARGTQFSFEQTAVALQNFVGGSIDAATATRELSNVVDLALVAKLTDLQQAVNIADLALTVFKDDGMEMADVIDTIATVAADVSNETDAWSSALVQSAGAAKAAGFSFKDLNIMFSAMKRGGADVNLMWAAFNSAMNRIQAPTKQSTEALEAVGLSTQGLTKALADGPIPLLNYLRQGFDKANQSGQGFAFLTQTLGAQAASEFALALGLTNEELVETAAYFENIDGKGAAMVERLREAMPATQMLAHSMRELSIRLGGALAPAMNAIVQALIPLVEKFAHFAEQNPRLTQYLIGTVLVLSLLTAALLPIGMALPGLIVLFTGLGAVFAAITAISAPMLLAIGAVAAILTLLITNGYLTKEAWQDVWLGIKLVTAEACNAVIGVVQNMINFVIDGVNKAINAINRVLSMAQKIPGFGKKIDLLGNIAPVNLGGIDTNALVSADIAARATPARTTSILVTGNTLLDEGAGIKLGDSILKQLRLSNQI